MNRILKLATNFFVGWYRMAALGAVAIIYAWYWLTPHNKRRKFLFITPDEHRREAERLRRERPDDPEMQCTATEHEQSAKRKETAKFKYRTSEFWWLLFFAVAMLVLYGLVYWSLN